MARGSLGSIFVDLLLRSSSFDEGLNRSRRSVTSATSVWTADLRKASTTFNRTSSQVTTAIAAINSSILSLGAGLAGAFSVSEVVRYSDAWKNLEGRLNLVATSSQELAATQERLFQIAQDTRSDFGATVTLYQRLTSAVKGLGISQQEIFKFTEQLNKQLITAGLTSNEAAASIFQLTQAFNKGKLDGDEFRTLLESAPPILEALSTSLGKTRGEIIEMSKAGQLAPQVLVDAVNQMADVTDERFAKFGLTIGQAFTQLDNAFLKYIGQSQAISGTTNSIALVVSAAAANFDVLAKAAIGLATVYAARLLPGITAVVTGFVAMQAQSLALQVTLGRMTGYSAAAAAALTGLGAAARGVSAAIGLLGGPVGVAAIYAISVLTLNTNKASEAQGRYADYINQITQLTGEMATADAQARASMIKGSENSRAALRAEAQELGELVEQYARRSQTSLALQRAASQLTFGLIRDPRQIAVDYSKAIDAINEGERKLAAAVATAPIKRTPLVSPVNDKAAKKAAAEAAKAMQELDRLYDRNREFITGLSAETLRYQDTQEELNKLFDSGKISLGEYAKAVQNLDKDYEKSIEKSKKSAEEAGVWSYDVAEAGRNASRSIQQSFADFLYDPFADGLQGMLEGFSSMLRRMVAEAASTEILGALFGTGGIMAGPGGTLGGIGSSIGNFFSGFFADGGYIPPGRFGIVGENGPEFAMGGNTGQTIIPMGGGGGAVVKVNIYNNNGSSVSTNTRRGPQGQEIDVMIDQLVAGKMATAGSMTNQALGDFTSRALTRR